jgi:hypothetical protein
MSILLGGLVWTLIRLKELNNRLLRTSWDVAGRKIGADGRSRTGTPLRHYPLKIACLPIPPHRLML